MDGTGTITTRELGPFLKALGQVHSEAELQEMISEVDEDASGVIDFPEMLSLIARKMKDDDTEEEVKTAFKVFDRNNTGEIELDDLKRVMTNLGDKLTDEEIRYIINEADVNGDGVIDNEEFIDMMMSR